MDRFGEVSPARVSGVRRSVPGFIVDDGYRAILPRSAGRSSVVPCWHFVLPSAGRGGIAMGTSCWQHGPGGNYASTPLSIFGMPAASPTSVLEEAGGHLTDWQGQSRIERRLDRGDQRSVVSPRSLNTPRER